MRNERVAIDTNMLLYILGGDKAAHGPTAWNCPMP